MGAGAPEPLSAEDLGATIFENRAPTADAVFGETVTVTIEELTERGLGAVAPGAVVVVCVVA